MLFVRRYSVILTLTALISLAIASCAGSKTQQCQKLLQVRERATNEVKSVTDEGKTRTPKAFITAADTLDKAAREMESIKLSDKRLQEYQTGFMKLYRDTAKATRDLANALNKKDRRQAQAALRNLQPAILPERELMTGLKSYCSSE